MAQKLSPHKIKLIGSPWSPPAWMKTNTKFYAGGQLRGEVGGEYYQVFADYFIKYEII
jgi:glucosylceramidase